MNKYLSIIVPCYNAVPYLDRCVNSLLAQTIGYEHMEMIFVNDASTDNTLDVLLGYEKKYEENIIVINCEKNGRQGTARNIGMSYATTEYMTFLDVDDELHPDALKCMLDYMQMSPCDFVMCDYKQVYTEADKGGLICSDAQYINMLDMQAKRRYILEHGWRTAVWGKLYRKEFLEENGIYFPENITMEDIYFSELCMLYATNIIYIPEQYYYYYYNPNGTMFSDKILTYYMDTPKVQSMVTKRVISEELLNDCTLEFQVLHFVKAFMEPVDRMLADKHFYSEDNLNWIREDIHKCFPDIDTNPYLLQDQSPKMQRYLEILKGGIV
ncbi:MAG: glycosyltransferase [Muribaculaceae bacterium]|nr:glycosyltransferase [Muribaculaceae bacterium]MCM1398940.1 glycosyltransferase [Clostridium sp.]MCM1458798.1 glycosyltransferase [Bacteroides sp.]